ncbi:MAG: RrF2 family transcriptional regulator [Dehalococcoidia bacterium]
MRVSTKGDYGIRALVELAQHCGEGPVQSAEIARRQCIPEPYLDQLLTTLRRAGFIRSVRGPQGGHALLREPDEIRLNEVIEALEGSLSPIACLDEPNCTKPGACAQRDVWEEVRRATHEILAGVTIGDLSEKEREATAAPRYYI